MRVLVCGGRDYEDRGHLEEVLAGWNITTIIEGGSRGADRLAREYGEKHGIAVRTFPAAWDAYGRSAGHIRNAEMLSKGCPDQVIAFWDGESKGTGNMISQAEKAGVPVTVVVYENNI